MVVDLVGMASREPPGAPARRAVADPSGATNTGPLPVDALHEILLRLPGKEICRLRVVCRPWRSLLSDPLFAAAHAARHPDPLIVVGYAEDSSNGIVFDIIDLSGRVVRRVKGTANATGFERVLSTQLDLICIAEGASGRCRVLNPGTGVVWTLPAGLAVEHAAHEPDVSHHRTSVAIGQVTSTGEYKLLRVLDCSPNRKLQLYEVITLAGSSHIWWRGKTAPPYTVALGTLSSVVIDGVVYFFSNDIGQGQEQDVTPFCVGSFNLETEGWRPTIRGPLRSILNAAAGLPHSQITWDEFSLAVLNGCLVLVHQMVPYLKLWFLEDAEKGLWVMQHSIQVGTNDLPAGINYRYAAPTVRQILALNDGTIVLVYNGSRGSVKIYNMKTDTSTDMAEIGPFAAIGLYTGNLLSLANGARP